jgi:hypothetical protein
LPEASGVLNSSHMKAPEVLHREREGGSEDVGTGAVEGGET